MNYFTITRGYIVTCDHNNQVNLNAKIAAALDGGTVHPATQEMLKQANAAPDLWSAARDALSDLKWIEDTVPGSNFQASIKKLEWAISRIEGR